MRFKIGDKVIVKSIQGHEDAWAGEVVTIIGISDGISKGNWVQLEEDGYRRYIEDERLLPLPKPGDRVKIRTWEDMEKQYGFGAYNEINCPTHRIIKMMKKYCGTIQVVAKLVENAFEIEKDWSPRFRWGFETIEEVYPKEEKMEFTKDMLKSGEHVVEYREGGRALYRKGCFVGPKAGTYAREYSDDLKNVWEGGDDRFDIVAVYEAISSPSFEYMLNHSDKLIWKRDEEPIEISATEAFAQLKEIYGKEVKIVEDKDE